MGYQVHQLIGVALGMLIVYRTNSSYDRFHEGRRQWGALINCSRNIVRFIRTMERETPIQQFGNLVTTFAFMMKNRLRGKVEMDEVVGLVSKRQLKFIEDAKNRPLAVSTLMTDWVAKHCHNCKKDMILYQSVEFYIQQFIDAQGALERIALTPVPFNYVVHVHQTLFYYLITLPFCMINDYGWFAVPSVMYIGFVLLGIEQSSIEMEDPFGNDKFDLPLDRICANIKDNMNFLAEVQQLDLIDDDLDNPTSHSESTRPSLPAQVTELEFPMDSESIQRHDVI
jgi:putative membrane protein